MHLLLFRRIVVMMWFMLVAWPMEGVGQESSGDPKNGKILFEKHCANCHGEKGDGQGPDTKFLTVQPADFHSLSSRSKTDDELMSIITYGSTFSPMHGWADRLTEAERWDILRYIRLLAPFNPMAFQQRGRMFLDG